MVHSLSRGRVPPSSPLNETLIAELTNVFYYIVLATSLITDLITIPLKIMSVCNDIVIRHA